MQPLKAATQNTILPQHCYSYGTRHAGHWLAKASSNYQSQPQSLYGTEYASERIATSQLSQNASIVLLNPFQYSTKNIYVFDPGMRHFISSVGFVFPTVFQFFFAMALGGVSARTNMHATFSTGKNYLIRFLISRLWTFIIALSWAGWFFCLAEGRTGIYKHSFILLTLNMWVYAMIGFEYHDTCAAFVPIEFLPITVLAWIIINVSAALFPIPVKPAFYHFDYAVPSFDSFELIITILSGGSTNRVYRNVPVLFACLIISGTTGAMANMKRCRLARKMAVEEKQSMPASKVLSTSSKDAVDQHLVMERTVESDFEREALS